jgi:dephospho-CoA kinase
VREAVVGRFGTVDRDQLAQRAFAAQEDREWLEGLLWPRVAERMVHWRSELDHRNPRPRAGVVEVPLLFESGMADAFDATIAVIAEEELRAQRAASRGHHAVDERLARQLPQHEKAQRATYVVVNDGSVAELEDKLSAVLDMLDR